MSSMKQGWQNCKNLLVVRPDNLGDLLMSTPAIHALKKTFGCTITVLTSSAAGSIAAFIDDIDDVIVADVPWVKSDKRPDPAQWNELTDLLRKRQFDGAVIFTVFSQNPMPSILLTWLAGIPRRLAFCRENPYHLLTEWVPEQEPYVLIRHQVERDLHLVAAIGARCSEHHLRLQVPNNAYSGIHKKLAVEGIDPARPWIMVHPGASERKREFPAPRLKMIIRKLINDLGLQVILTGTDKDRQLTLQLCESVAEEKCRSVAGKFSIAEFMALIDIAPLALSVNTGTVHLAAALNTPVVVLYANTNPQHTPWKVPNEVFMFPVEEGLRSKNEVLRFVTQEIMGTTDFPDADAVVSAVRRLLRTDLAPRL